MRALRLLIAAAALSLLATPAHAVPLVGAVVGLVGAIGTAITALGAVGNVLVGLAVSAGLSYLSQALSKNKGDTGQPKAGSIGTELEVSIGEETPRSFLVGRCAVKGSLVYADTHTDLGEIGHVFLVQVFAISDWPIESLEELYVDAKDVNYDPDETHEQPALSNTFGVPIDDYKYADEDLTGGTRDYLWVKVKDGTQTAADSYLTTKFGSGAYAITSNFKGTNVAYLIVTTRYGHPNLQGPPDITFECKGIALYDPRLDTTAGGSGSHRWADQSTWEWTENPMVIAYNILRGLYLDGAWFYGLQNMNAQRLPYADWAAAMNECDANVAKKGGGTETQFTCGAEIPVDTPIIDVLDALMTSCNGRITESGGIYKPKVGAVGASVLSFTDGNVLTDREQVFEPIRSQADSVTGVTATIRSPKRAWNRHTLPPRNNAALEAEEGDRRLVADISYDFVSRNSQGQRLMKAELLDAGRTRRHLIPMPPEAYVLEPGDAVDWTSARNGYDEKIFDVEGVQISDTMEIMLAIRERDPDDYDFDPDAEEEDIDPVEITITAPTSYAVQGFGAAGEVLVGDNGKKEIAIKCEWTPFLTRDLLGIDFQCRLVSDTTKVTREFSSDFQDGEHRFRKGVIKNTAYQIRARYRPKSNRAAPWTDWEAVSTSSSGLLPSAPTGLALRPGLEIMEVRWADPTAGDISHVEVYISEDSNVANATRHGSAIAGAESYVIDGLSEGTAYWVWLVAVDYDGNRSAAAGPKTAETLTLFGDPNTVPPGDVTSITTSAGFHVIALGWTNPTDDDLASIEIWMSTTSAQSAAEKVYETAAPGESGIASDLDSDVEYWFWIRPRDRWDNYGNFVSAGSATTLAGVDEILAGAITETEIADDSISTPKLQANSIVAAKIAALAITADLIAAEAITAGKIAADAVTAGKIAADAVTADNILAGAVVAGKINTNAVTAGTIAVGAINAHTLIVDAVIRSNHIQTGSINADHIQVKSLDADEILLDGTLITDLIDDDAVTAPKFDSNGSNVSLTSLNTYYDVATVNVPEANKAVYAELACNAEALLSANSVGTGTARFALCRGDNVLLYRDVSVEFLGTETRSVTIDFGTATDSPGSGTQAYKLRVQRRGATLSTSVVAAGCLFWVKAPKK